LKIFSFKIDIKLFMVCRKKNWSRKRKILIWRREKICIFIKFFLILFSTQKRA
jgi:hypothetical protein